MRSMNASESRRDAARARSCTVSSSDRTRCMKRSMPDASGHASQERRTASIASTKGSSKNGSSGLMACGSGSGVRSMGSSSAGGSGMADAPSRSSRVSCARSAGSSARSVSVCATSSNIDLHLPATDVHPRARTRASASAMRQPGCIVSARAAFRRDYFARGGYAPPGVPCAVAAARSKRRSFEPGRADIRKRALRRAPVHLDWCGV